jgi:hypothetical protein
VDHHIVKDVPTRRYMQLVSVLDEEFVEWGPAKESIGCAELREVDHDNPRIQGKAGETADTE